MCTNKTDNFTRIGVLKKLRKKIIFQVDRFEPNKMITTLVIMMLTVVYNESQYVTDYQDVYQKAFKKSGMHFDLCDSALQKKLCEISFYGWRQLSKKNDVIDLEGEDPNKYHDLMNDEIAKNLGEKRHYKSKPDNNNNCEITQTPIDLGNRFFPKVLLNVSCLHTSSGDLNGNPICLAGSNCQPVEYKARVLTRRTFDDTMRQDFPAELEACWMFAYKTIHVGCKCAATPF